MFGKFSVIFSVGISIVLAYFGLDYITRKWPSLSATAEVSYKRLFSLYSLRGPRAILFGASCVVGAAVIIAPWVMDLINQTNTPTDEVVIFAAMIGLVIPVIGFVLATFFEFLETLRLLAVRRKTRKLSRQGSTKK